MTLPDSVREAANEHMEDTDCCSHCFIGGFNLATQRAEKLVKALDHYADPTQYEDRGLGTTDESVAREALEQWEAQ